MGVDRQVDYGVLGLEATVPLGPCTPSLHAPLDLLQRDAQAQVQAQAGTQSLRCASRPLQLVQTATAT